MTAVAALFAGLAAWFAVTPAGSAHRLAPPGPARAKRAPSRRLLALPAALAWVALGLTSAPGAVAAALSLVAAVAAWLYRRRRAGRQALARTQETARAARLLDSLLAQGHVPRQALGQAALDCPLLAPAAATAKMGGDPAGVLTELARQPGAEALAEIARAFQITARTGAPLHGVLKRVVASVQAEAELARLVAEELAGPRATGHLLAALPFAGLGLAVLLGTDPLGFLTGSPPGRAVLLLGLGLAAAGAAWNEALASRAAELRSAP